MARAYATYLCGGPELLREGAPCPEGGPLHDPMPAGYGPREEYAAQLLRTGWTQHRCPGCGLWMLWRPRLRAPQPQPPMRPRPSRRPWTVPDGPICRPCDEGRPCPVIAA